MPDRPVFEICVDSVAGVRAARAAGADRVELCADLGDGGLTPSSGLIGQALAVAGPLKVHVLIRPRPGDFVYDADEYDVMRRDIEAAVAAGAHGVVIGVLRPDDTVDADRTAALQALTQKPVTFHRAFDLTADPDAALRTLIELGIERVLTSGQAASAAEGAEVLARLNEQADGRIAVMAGGGITPDNVAGLRAATGVGELHFSGSQAVPADSRVRLGRGEERLIRTSAERIGAIIAAATAAG